MKDNQNSGGHQGGRDDDIESRVDELMAVERDDRHPDNKKKALEDIVLEKPNLPMAEEHLEVRVIHPDTLPSAKADGTKKHIDAPIEEVSVDNSNLAGDNKNEANEADQADANIVDIAKSAIDSIDDELDSEGEGLEDETSVGEQDYFDVAQQPSGHRGLVVLLQAAFRWVLRPRQLVLFGLFILLIVIVVLSIPTYRYSSLNALGVRTTASMYIVDTTTDMPLKNVAVTLGDQQQQTNDDGRVVFDSLALGRQPLRIERRAFAEREIDVVLGVRANELGEYWLYPTGVQYKFLLKDYVAGTPVAGVEVVHDEASAFSSPDGVAVLTVDVAADQEEISIEIIASGYRPENRTLLVDQTDKTEVVLVPALQHVYVQPPPGQPDIMAAYLDQSDEKVLLEATGKERRDITLVPHPTKNYVAVMTTQDDDRNDDGFLLTTLTIIDITSGATGIIAQSERLQPVEWYGDRFVYVKARSGVTGMDTRRHQLVSYDLDSDTTTTLASSNYFNAVLPTERYIYYAPSSIFLEEPTTLRRVSADGVIDETTTTQEAWSAYRHDFNTLVFATNSQWFEYDMSTGKVVERADEMTTITSRLYRQNPLRDDWFVTSHTNDDDQRQVLLYDAKQDTHSVIVEGDGIRHPVRWLHEHIVVYRAEVDEQLIDYAHHIDADASRKLWPVGASSSLERWYSF